MNHPIIFLDRGDRTKLMPVFFLIKRVIVITVIIFLCIINKLIKLFYLHCPCKKKVVKGINRDNLNAIKYILPNKSRNPEGLKKIIAVGKIFN